MSHFRSSEMHLYKICVSKDNAWKQIHLLGDTKLIHFININKNKQPFNLPYTQQLKRCDEILKNVQILMENTQKPQVRPASMKEFNRCIESIA
jgi:hypothetical protein